MENSNKYDSYFKKDASKPKDDETNKEKKKGSNLEYKMPISKPRKISGDQFQQPELPNNKKFLIKDVNDLKSMNLEELSQLPYTKGVLKKLNMGNNNIDKFQNLNQLYDTFGEDLDYEVVDLQELKNYMGAEFDENMLIPSEDQIATLEKEMQDDPQNFNTLLKLMYVYKETNKKEKLKSIREHTANLFPLSEDLWKEWIKDELSEIPQDDLNTRYELIEVMFKRAIKDFNYYTICKRMLKYMINLKKEIEFRHININQETYNSLTTENIRKLFEEFLEVWGLDFTQSGRLWDLYLNFEFANLDCFKKIKDEVNINQSLNIIRSIFRRRLSFAHIDLDIVWGEYSNWEKNESELKKVQTKYYESSKNVENMINIEETFTDLLNKAKTEDNSDELCKFLKTEIPKISQKHFNYLRLYFEKALELNPDDENIWELYIDYAKKLNKNKELTLNILKRACKCCYFNIIFWILLLREMEKSQKPFEEIQKKIQEAYITAEDGNFKSEIWKYSLEFSCRQFDSTFEQLEQIRSSFNTALIDIEANGNIEYVEKIYSIWIEFEVYKVKDYNMFTQLINKVVRLDSSPENWRRFINYEKYFGDVVSIRKAFKRAVEYCREDKEKFSENWISWEKIFGSAGETEEAINFSKKKNLKRLVLNKGGRNLRSGNKNLDEKGNLGLEPEGLDLMEIDDASSVKSSEENKGVDFYNNSNKTVIIKNLSLHVNEEDLETFIKSHNSNERFIVEEIRIVRDKTGNSKGFAFVDFSSTKEAAEFAKVLNNQIFDDNILSCAVSKPPALGANDKRTIFVNNLPFDATEDSIKSIFEPYGQILDIRLIYDKILMKPKGYCYVEFAEEDSLSKVMENKSNFVINGRKVIIKPSQSVTKLREDVRSVAYVTNLPFSYTESNLKSFFEKNEVDKIIDCLITKDDSGNSKGYGFVEFENEEALKKALKLTGKTIRGRCISIQVSKSNITRSKKRKAEPMKEEDDDDELLKKKRKNEKQDDGQIEHEQKDKVAAKQEKLSNQDFRKFLKK